MMSSDTDHTVRVEEKKIFVGGLNSATTNETLKDYFIGFGEVSEAAIMIDPTTNRSRGFGFVTFSNPGSVAAVLCGDKHIIDGKKVDPKPAYEKGHEAKVQEIIHLAKVFVGGLPQSATKDSVKQYFEQFGTVTDVDLKNDKTTLRMRGFGFVAFEQSESAVLAAAKQFQTYEGKTIEVKPAEARDKRTKTSQTQSSYNMYQHPTHYQDYASTYSSQGGYGGYHHQYAPYGYSNPSSGYSQSSYNYGAPPHQHHQDYSSYGHNTAGAISYSAQQDFTPYNRGYTGQQQMQPAYPHPPPHPSHHPMSHTSQDTSAFAQHRAPATYGTPTADNYSTHQYYSYDTNFAYSDQSLAGSSNPSYGGRGSNTRGVPFAYGRQ